MAHSTDGAVAHRLSPLFTWRAAIASLMGPGQVILTLDSGQEIVVKGATQRHVALVLSLHMSERGDSCFPGVTRIATESDLSERAVQRALRALHQCGWLVVEQQGGPKGTNLYTAALPQGYVYDQGGVLSSGGGANPVREGGEPSSPEVAIESVKEPKPTARTEHVRMVESVWLTYAPPLILHRETFFAEQATTRVIRKALDRYGVNDVTEAVRNYAVVLGGDDHRWDHRWTIIDFLKRGLDRFVPEARPLENFRIRASGEKFGRRDVSAAEMFAAADRLEAERLEAEQADERRALEPG